MRAVLGDPSYRYRARHMRGDIHAPPGAAAEALERLVHEHTGGTHVPGRGVGKQVGSFHSQPGTSC